MTRLSVPAADDRAARWSARWWSRRCPSGRAELAKQVALGWSLVVLLLAVLATVAFEAGGDRFQFRESYAWIPTWGARFTFAVDGIALVMLLLIALLVPLVILASWHDARHRAGASMPAYFALLLALEAR